MDTYETNKGMLRRAAGHTIWDEMGCAIILFKTSYTEL